MPDSYIHRSLESIVQKATREFPVVVLIGPRQSGKTTLLRHLFTAQYLLVSMDAPDVRAAAAADPRGFLELYRSPVIFDEIQNAPGLLPYIKEQVDLDRDQPGQFILTGSLNLLLMRQVTESLAGRAAILKLLPVTSREAQRQPERPFAWETPPTGSGRQDISLPELWQLTLRGFYPELVSNPDREAVLWQASYMQTYLERDVRSLRNIGDLSLFQTFLRALAARSAQLLNLSDLARDVGVSVNTAKDWLSLLEASFQIFILRPYYANIGKRLVKSPKVYFTDTGLLCYLVGLRDPLHAASGPMGGAIMENLVAAEIYKSMVHRGEEPRLYFWRTAAGVEVDLVVDFENRLIPIEIKASATARPQMADGILSFHKDFGERAMGGFVVYPGKSVLPLGEKVLALPFDLV